MPHPLVATLATIPSRAEHLPHALLSIHGQVDELCIAFDGYASLEAAAKALEPFEGVAWRAAALRYTCTDYGDAAKLIGLDLSREADRDSVALVCDDDLEYPPDYASWMVDQLRLVEARVGGPCLVSLHGSRLPSTTRSYRDERRMVQHCLGTPSPGGPAHVLGTGVLAGRVDLLRDFLDGFDFARAPRNALDLHLALWAEARKIPRFVVPMKRDGFLRHLLPSNTPTIWDDADVAKENALVASTTWGALS